jgi:hypothetical protein
MVRGEDNLLKAFMKDPTNEDAREEWATPLVKVVFVPVALAIVLILFWIIEAFAECCCCKREKRKVGSKATTFLLTVILSVLVVVMAIVSLVGVIF